MADKKVQPYILMIWHQSAWKESHMKQKQGHWKFQIVKLQGKEGHQVW